MPLSELDELLSYAEAREAEKALLPLWTAHFITAKITGNDPMSYEELLSKSTEREPGDQIRKVERSPEEIKNSFSGIIATYRLNKGVDDG
ncbi:MAG: hypothetical protein ACI3XR_08580 [Eubacteriales bacterium]